MPLSAWKRLFTELVRHGMEVMGIKGPIPRELQEIRTMFPGLAWREEVLKEGEKEGEKKGMKEGRATTLLRQLRRRFGAPPSYVESLVGEAESGQLDVWLDAVIDAPSLEAIFGKRVN